MTCRTKRRETLPELILDMEAGVAALVNFALVVRDLGTCGAYINPAGLYAIGECMVDQAQAIQEEWQRCFDLSRVGERAR
jgi:hypothetical protein